MCFFLLEKMKNCDGLNSNFLKEMSLHDVRLDSDSFYGYGFGAPMYGALVMGLLMVMVELLLMGILIMVVKGMENGFVVFYIYIFVYSLRILLYTFGQ